jgi:hypothetical protein
VGKTFQNRIFRPVLVRHNTLTAKTMPGAVHLRARAVKIDFFSNRALFCFLFHQNGSFFQDELRYHKTKRMNIGKLFRIQFKSSGSEMMTQKAIPARVFE